MVRVCADCRRPIHERAYLEYVDAADGAGRLVCPDCHEQHRKAP